MSKRDAIGRGEAIIEERQRAMEKMCPSLRKKLDWILEWQRTEHCQSLVGRWDLGSQVDDVYQDLEQNGGKVYGQNALGRLELFMHEDKSVLSQARRLFQAYPDRKRIQEICEMVMQDGVTHISYSHIRQLVSIKDEQKRQEALNMALENCWTSAELGVHVQNLNGGCRSNNPRGRASIPKDADTVISQQLAFIEDFDNRNIRVWNDPECSLTAQIDKMEPEEYTEELAKKLGQVAKRMRQLADDANKRADEAEHQYTEIIRAMQANKTKAKPVAELIQTDDNGAHLPDNPRNRPVGRRAKVVG